MRETHKGPGDLLLVLDSAEIVPDDPGAGTPAMVHLGNFSATYWWACGEGTVYGTHDVDLSQSQINWLHAQEDLVNGFLNQHSN